MRAGEPDAGAEGAPVDAGKAFKVAQVLPGKKRGRLLVVSLHSGEAMWAQVSIDGVPMKRTPYTSDWLAVGPHSVTVERSGFRTQQRWVNVVAGKTTPVKFDLRP